MSDGGTPGAIPPGILPEHRELLGQVLDRWSLQVVEELCGGPRRFNELRHAIPAVSPKPLTVTLRRLERNGMLLRTVVSARPLTVEYEVTDLTRTLQSLLDQLHLWSAQNLPAVERARDSFDGADGQFR